MNVRIKLCAVLVFFQAVSYFALQLTPRNDLYYFVAGLFSFLILPTIAKIGSYQEVIDVLFLALIMLGFQFIGGMIYHFDELEIPIWIYNGAIKILLALQFLRLLIIRKNDGVEQNNNFVYLLCRSNPKGSGNLC